MLTVLLLGQFMALVDLTIVNVAMPTIGTDLSASGAGLQLVVGGYTVAYAMLLITGARLGDLYGRRRMYLLGVLAFTVSSLACGLAPTTEVLVAARFAQGAGAAVMVPQIISVIQMRFTGADRATALSAYGAVLSGGAVIGFVLGGVLVSADLLGLSWRPVFLVNIPLGLALLYLVPRLVPADEPSGTRRLDLAGLGIAVPAVFLVVLPLVLGRETGWPAWTFAAMAAGVALAAAFVVVERRITARGGDPLLNLDVLRAAGMPSGLLTLLCVTGGYGGLAFTLALHLQSGLGDSALRAGLTMSPMAVAVGISAFYWRVLPARLHPYLPPTGMVLFGLGFAGIGAGLRGGGQDDPLLWVSLVVAGAGMGLLFSLLTQSLVHVPLTKAADASGLLTTTMQLGQLGGVTVFGVAYLSLLDAPTVTESAHAIAATTLWLALLAGAGAVTGAALTRTIRRAS